MLIASVIIGMGYRLVAVFLASLAILAGMLCLPSAGHAAAQPAYPGIVGHGAVSVGGRGGEIVVVSNLDDSGPGSLREAIERKEARIIVFGVSGTILLRKPLIVRYPYITVAGQTAPAPGITIQGQGCMDVRTHDVIVQHLRLRAMGSPGDKEIDIEYRDGFQITGSSGYPPHSAYNIVLDHVSVSHAGDEGGSVWCARDVTISNCLIALSEKGVLIGNNSRNVTLINNLVLHNKTRQPRVNAGVTADIIRNIFYNGPVTQMQIGETAEFPSFTSRPYPDQPSYLNIIGNSFVAIPSRKDKHRPVQLLYVNHPLNAKSKIHLRGNTIDGAPLVVGRDFFWDTPSSPVALQPLNEPLPVLAADATVSEGELLARVGARPRERDKLDEDLIASYLHRRDRPVAVVPDQTARPVNVRSPAIPHRPHDDDDGDGITNIEAYLHNLSMTLIK